MNIAMALTLLHDLAETHTGDIVKWISEKLGEAKKN